MAQSAAPHHSLISIISNTLWKTIDLIAQHHPSFARKYYTHYIGSAYQKEYEKFNICESDSVLHVGCGTFPLTEIMLARSCQATIYGIDNRTHAISAAQHYLNYQGLTDIITIEYADGINHDYAPYSVIIISSCASPKQTILDAILTTAHPNTRIILREVESHSAKILSFIDQKPLLQLLDHMSNHPFPFFKPFGWNSYLLQIIK